MLSDKHVQLNETGQAERKLQMPWRDGTAHLVMSPSGFLLPLAALVPRPRHHLNGFRKVLASKTTLRALVMPQGAPAQAQAASWAAAAAECDVEPVQARRPADDRGRGSDRTRRLMAYH